MTARTDPTEAAAAALIPTLEREIKRLGSAKLTDSLTELRCRLTDLDHYKAEIARRRRLLAGHVRRAKRRLRAAQHKEAT